MNKVELEVEMKRHNDTGQTLSKELSMTGATFSKKLNGKADFTRAEIMSIKDRYDLSADRVDEIFFSK